MAERSSKTRKNQTSSFVSRQTHLRRSFLLFAPSLSTTTPPTMDMRFPDFFKDLRGSPKKMSRKRRWLLVRSCEFEDDRAEARFVELSFEPLSPVSFQQRRSVRRVLSPRIETDEIFARVLFVQMFPTGSLLFKERGEKKEQEDVDSPFLSDYPPLSHPLCHRPTPLVSLETKRTPTPN